MCGIAGLISTAAVDERAVARLIRPIAHRGPDDDGIWVDAEAGVGLGHRRLAIVDLSPAGPPADALGRRPLRPHLQRRDLQPRRAARASSRRRARSRRAAGAAIPTPRFSSRASSPGGWPRRCARSAGMFAFALWDRKERTLEPGPRPVRREAALLRLGRAATSCSAPSSRRCARIPRFDNRDRPPGAAAVRRAHLHPGAAVDLRAACSSCRPAAS